MKGLKFHILFLSTFLLLCQSLLAQQKETQYYYYAEDPTKLIPIDSGLNNIEHYNFMQRAAWDSYNLGNTGQAHQSLALDFNERKGFKSGMTHFDLYKLSLRTIKYYQINKPVSEIHYYLGSKRENVFGASFAQNIKNRLEYGFDFHRVASTGVYRNIQARNGSFALFSKFSSKNSRYNLQVEISFTKIKSQENGGLVEDFVNNTSLAASNKEFYDPQLSEGLTQHRNLEVLVTQSYHFGYSKIRSVNDSLQVKEFHPSYSLNYSTGTEKNTFSYVDNAADSSYYGAFFQEQDSTFYRLYYHQIPNKLSLSYSGLKKMSDSLVYRNISGEVGIQHDNIELWQNRAEFTTNNLHLSAQIQSTTLANKAWSYKALGYYYLAGYNQNDWKIKGQFAYDFKKLGFAQLQASMEQQEASWIENSYFSKSQKWQNNFDKKTRLLVSLDYTHTKARLKLHAEYNVLGKYIYFDQESLPQQLSKGIHYYQAYAAKDLSYKFWHFENFVGIQGSNNQSILRLPRLFIKSSFYVEGNLFKKNMLARIGLDMRYNSNFSAYAWNPLVGQFHLQSEQNMRYLPILDVFLSFKVKSLRVFAKANYINEGLGQKNVYTALGYPDRGRTFAGGLIWRFFE